MDPDDFGHMTDDQLQKRLQELTDKAKSTDDEEEMHDAVRKAAEIRKLLKLPDA